MGCGRSRSFSRSRSPRTAAAPATRRPPRYPQERTGSAPSEPCAPAASSLCSGSSLGPTGRAPAPGRSAGAREGERRHGRTRGRGRAHRGRLRGAGPDLGPARTAFGAYPAGGIVGELFGELARSLFSTAGSLLVGFACLGLVLISRAAFSFIALARLVARLAVRIAATAAQASTRGVETPGGGARSSSSSAGKSSASRASPTSIPHPGTRPSSRHRALDPDDGLGATRSPRSRPEAHPPHVAEASLATSSTLRAERSRPPPPIRCHMPAALACGRAARPGPRRQPRPPSHRSSPSPPRLRLPAPIRTAAGQEKACTKGADDRRHLRRAREGAGGARRSARAKPSSLRAAQHRHARRRQARSDARHRSRQALRRTRTSSSRRSPTTASRGRSRTSCRGRR